MLEVCWICNENKADSEEHRFKASDIKKRYGKKFDAFQISDSNFRQVQSYKEKSFKYQKIICTDCNNNKTRHADDAYDIFVHKISEDPYSIVENGRLNFELLYGEEWKKGKRSLFSYIAKHIGCEIKGSVSGENIDVKKLSDFILEKNNYLDFSVNFIINPLLFEFIVELRKQDELKNFNPLGFSDTVYFTINSIKHFSGTMINHIYRTEWFYLNNSRISSKNNLNDKFENLEILNKDIFYEESFQNRTRDEFIVYLLQGVYKNFNLYLDYVRDKFQDDFC